MATTPRVVPAPKSVIWVVVRPWRVTSPGRKVKITAMAMTIRLFRTGVTIGAPKRPRMLRIAPIVAPIP